MLDDLEMLDWAQRVEHERVPASVLGEIRDTLLNENSNVKYFLIKILAINSEIEDKFIVERFLSPKYDFVTRSYALKGLWRWMNLKNEYIHNVIAFALSEEFKYLEFGISDLQMTALQLLCDNVPNDLEKICSRALIYIVREHNYPDWARLCSYNKIVNEVLALPKLKPSEINDIGLIDLGIISKFEEAISS